MKIDVNMYSPAEILRRRGLEPNGRVQKLFTNEVARYSDPYVPMQQGILKNTLIIEDDGIIYNTPYARYQYHRKLMVGRAPKQLTDQDLTYHGAPRRGGYWERRMWAEKKSIIMHKVAGAAGGLAE